MASTRQIVVFVLPVIFSIAFGSIVMADTVQKPDRELNMWPMSFSEGDSSHNSKFEFIGLSNHYLNSEPIEIQVKINDSTFSCGDLYITIYNSENDEIITQDGFFNQCIENGNFFPNDDKFSKVITTSGSYKITADMISKDLSEISAVGIFTIK
ncbi:MAG TPA: hypothetical protein QF656_00795 [Nitrosopumilus sp.]|jgi:hypothetical protein|nr:hypothetical protein [Nitrosopumilus sp.]